MPGGGDATDRGADPTRQRRRRRGQGRPLAACSRAGFKEQTVSSVNR